MTDVDTDTSACQLIPRQQLQLPQQQQQQERVEATTTSCSRDHQLHAGAGCDVTDSSSSTSAVMDTTKRRELYPLCSYRTLTVNLLRNKCGM